MRGLETRPLWQHLLWSALEYVSQIQIMALCVWFVRRTIFFLACMGGSYLELNNRNWEMASLGFISFMKDHEGSGDLASVATPLVVHPGYVSQIHIMALCVWFVHRTICEGWVNHPVTDLRSLFD